MKKITLFIILFLNFIFTTHAQNKYLNISTAGSRIKILNSVATDVSASDKKTITFRIKIPSGVSNNTNFSKIMLKNDAAAIGAGSYGLSFGSASTAAAPHTDIRLVASSTTPTATGNTDNGKLAIGLNDTNWHHFALVLNDIDGKSRLYYDGKLLITSSATTSINMTNTNDLYFGAASAGGTPILMSIDDIRIWNTALTPYQIATDINTPINTATASTYTNLLAAYDFEAATLSANGIPDITGLTTAATLIQAATPTNSIITGSSDVILPTTTWNGTSWTNGAPTSTIDAIITGNYNEAATITANSLTINNNAVVTIPSGYNIALYGALNTISGSVTLENNAKLTQSTLVANTGAITIKRDSAPMTRLDYTLWSSPVASQNLFNFSPATVTTPTTRFYSYNTTNNGFDNTGINTSSAFITGKGYAVRAPNTYSTTPAVFTGQFTGVPNNGSITIALDNSNLGFNLVGNPYPCPIDASSFVTANTSISGTLYFYSHNAKSDGTAYETSSGGTGMQYATWNSTGATAAASGVSGIGQNTNVPNGTIQVGQGFIVKATTAGNLSFTNTMRTTSVAANADQFFKMVNTKSTTAAIATEKHRLWLDLSNENGDGLSQLLVGYVDGATNDTDNLYDGEEFGNPQTSLTSLLNGKNYTIQGRALPFADTDSVPLAFKAATKGTYTIALSKTDGIFTSNQEVLLKDNTTGTVKNLKTGGYTFTATAGTTNSRFELAYTKSAINAIGIEVAITVLKKQGIFQISTDGAILKEITVYDMQGREVLKQQNINSTASSLTGLPSTRGILILKVTTDTNQNQTIKIIN